MQRVVTPFDLHRVQTTTATDSYEALTGWFPAVGIDEARGTVYADQLIGAMTCALVLQTATVRRECPDAWNATAIFNPGSGGSGAAPFRQCTGDMSLTTALSQKTWVRFGKRYKKGATGTYTQADIAGQLSFVNRGMIVGEMPTTTLYSDTWSTTSPTGWATLWATRWIPAQWVEKARAAVALGNDELNAVSVRPVYQTATTKISEPTGWTALGGSVFQSAGDGCTTDTTLSITDKMWVRFGIQVRAVSDPGAGLIEGVTVSATISARRT